MNLVNIVQLVMGGATTVVWLSLVVIFAKMRGYYKEGAASPGKLLVDCMFHRAAAGCLLPVAFNLAGNSALASWSRTSCRSTSVIILAVFCVFCTTSFFAMCIMWKTRTNPFRAYGVVEVKSKLCCITLTSVVVALQWIIQSGGLLEHDAYCLMFHKCIQLSTAPDLYLLALGCGWLLMSSRMLLTAAKGRTRSGYDRFGLTFCSNNFCEALVMVAFLLYKVTSPCFLQNEDSQSLNGFWVDQMQLCTLASMAVLLVTGIVTLAGADPRHPECRMVQSLWLYSLSGTRRWSVTKECWGDAASFIDEDERCKKPDEVLRGNAMLAITRGIVSSLSRSGSTVSSAPMRHATREVPLLAVQSERQQLVGAHAEGDTGNKSEAQPSQPDAPMFEFVDFAPDSFCELRLVFGINEEEYLMSIQKTWERNGLEMQVSNSRSGSFFYFTHDARFMVKSMSGAEAQLLQALLPSYMQYVRLYPGTLLPQFFGCHAIKRGKHGQLVHFVVMANVNHALHSAAHHESGSNLEMGLQHGLKGCGLRMQSFDLKGSTVQRTAGEHASTKKDNDLAAAVTITCTQQQQMLGQLERDCDWLCGHGIMDYSLLVTMVDPIDQQQPDRWLIAHACCTDVTEAGTVTKDQNSTPLEDASKLDPLSNVGAESIHHPPQPVAGRARRRSIAHSSHVRRSISQRESLVCVGLIDILQEFDCGKRCELLAKSVLHCSKRDGLSCLPPKPYRERFMKSMRERVFTT